MSTTKLTYLANNSTVTNFDEISLRLEQYYQRHPITPLKQLRIRRSVLVKDMYVLDNKLFDLEQNILDQYQKLKERSIVDLSVIAVFIQKEDINQNEQKKKSNHQRKEKK